MLRFFLPFLLMPTFVCAQVYSLTAFGQWSSPTGDYADKGIGGAKAGYGGGADLDVFLNDNFAWKTTASFSANKLTNPTPFGEKELFLSDSYFYYNLPVITGIAWRRQATSNLEFVFFAQTGVNYAEFPNIEGTIEDNSKYPDTIETSFQGRTNWGYVLGGGVTFYQKATLSLRYMNFGDYAFSGDYYSSKTALYREHEQKTPVSFFMLTFGYNFNLSEEK